MKGFAMKIKIEKLGNKWKLTINDNEFISSNECSIEELTQLVLTLVKFEGISAEIDFTNRH